MNGHEIMLSNGKRELTLNELGTIQPGMDRLMHEIGQRAWRLYYAATYENWQLADYFLRTLTKMLSMSAFVRPRYSEAMEQFLTECVTPLRVAVATKDCVAFQTAWDYMVAETNRWHASFGFGYIVWQTPATPPPDLNVEPQQSSRPKALRPVRN